MRIFTPTVDQLEELYDSFSEKVNSGLRTQLVRPETLISGHQLIVATDEKGELRGILAYKIVDPEDHYDLRDMLAQSEEIFPESPIDENGNEMWEIHLQRTHGFGTCRFESPLAYVTEIETFPKRKGIGRELIQALKNQEDLEGIFLESDVRATIFYGKNGFHGTGLYVQDQPIMIWKHDEIY